MFPLSLMRCKRQNPLHQFPRNKLVRAKVRCVCCVVSFPKFHYNDLLDLFARQQVRNKLATSPSMGKLRGNVCNGSCTLVRLTRGSDAAVVLTRLYLMNQIMLSINHISLQQSLVFIHSLNGIASSAAWATSEMPTYPTALLPA